MSPYVAEFVGTMLLIILGDGVVASSLLKQSKGENGGWIVIVLTWGMTVALAIYAVGEYSGAHINPAVTISLAIYGSFDWALVPGYCLAQLLGAFVGAIVVWFHYLPHWKLTEDKGLKLAVFCTGPAVRSTWSNFFSEFIGTLILIFGLLFIGANSFADGLNPLIVGALISTIGFSLGGTTGFAINPARDLGPRIAHFVLPIAGKGTSDWGYSWIPVLGPIMGGMSGALLYQWLVS